MGAAGLQAMQAGGAVRPLDGIGLLDVDGLTPVVSTGVVEMFAGRAERLARLLDVQVERAQEKDDAEEPVSQPAEVPLHTHEPDRSRSPAGEVPGFRSRRLQ